SAGILIKDNHIAAVRARGETLADAVRAALAAAGPATAVEVEVTSAGELDEALEAGAHAILLDNFKAEDLPLVVARAHERGATTEASGGITLAGLRAVAESGVDYISLGALTHSVVPLDISLRVLPE
ncbi:MAG: nicotinate-nucleotide diphosphorylase (carboxylating), partial [Dehalococcoidia bacterium]